jgi:hypothetical protein
VLLPSLPFGCFFPKGGRKPNLKEGGFKKALFHASCFTLLSFGTGQQTPFLREEREWRAAPFKEVERL